MKKVLLYSGGMDSFILSELWKPDVMLFVDVGTEASALERSRLGHAVQVMELPLGQFEDPLSFALPIRNLFLLAAASYYGDHILLGSTREDVFLDGSIPFMKQMQKALNTAWKPQLGIEGRDIKIEKSFKKLDKLQLIELYVLYMQDREMALTRIANASMSCYQPTEHDDECFECMSCARKYIALKAAGFKWSDTVNEKVALYLQLVNYFGDDLDSKPLWFQKVVNDIRLGIVE